MTLGRMLCFSLGTESFAIPLSAVREVLGIPEIIPVPFAPPDLVGVMNLRGQVISLVDLRAKFNIKAAPSNETAVIICNLADTSIGIIVDSVDRVLNPQSGDLCPKPEIVGGDTSKYIDSVYRKDGKIVLFLDILKTLNLGKSPPRSHHSKSDFNKKAS